MDRSDHRHDQHRVSPCPGENTSKEQKSRVEESFDRGMYTPLLCLDTNPFPQLTFSPVTLLPSSIVVLEQADLIGREKAQLSDAKLSGQRSSQFVPTFSCSFCLACF